MTYPTIFANLAGGTQPASLLDTMYNICGNQGNIGCTAAGTNAITLTPNTNQFLPAAYVNFQMATFVAGATSTGVVTIQIGALGFVNLYNANGVQSNANDIASGTLYTVVFNQALNSGAGGFIITSAVTSAAAPTPQGYLTLVSATPIITSDTTISAGSPMFYTPFQGATVSIWNGSVWVATTFAELSLTMNAAHLASNLYDVFIFNNGGTLTLVTGPTWTTGGGSITPGSCARGTGAGSTQLQRTQGFWNNAVTVTGRNGVNTFTVNPGFGTYLGSIFMDTVNGQLTCHRSYGQSRKWGVWNNFQRQPIVMKAGDSTASWIYVTNAVRASNNATANSLTTFMGLAESPYDLIFNQRTETTTAAVATNTQSAIHGIGYNVTNAFSGTVARNQCTTPAAGNLSIDQTTEARFLAPPAIGINTVTACELCDLSTSSTSFFGTETNMLLTSIHPG